MPMQTLMLINGVGELYLSARQQFGRVTYVHILVAPSWILHLMQPVLIRSSRLSDNTQLAIRASLVAHNSVIGLS